MAKKTSNKKYQLVITGYLYDTGLTPSKVTMITKEELEDLTPLFEAISLNEDDYNWSATDSVFKNEFGGWIAHLDALYQIYSQFKGNDDFERLVIKTFPKSGRVDKIIGIEINEIKNIKTYL